MTWIKTNYDQFILGLVALLLCALSGFIIYNAMDFQQIFAGIKAPVFHNNNVPPLDTSDIQNAVASLQKPATWDLNSSEGSLFVSVPYIVGSDGVSLINPSTSPTMLHPPIPNKWLIDNKLDILDNNILNEDPDGTGFSVLDDWKNVKGDGSDSINPNDKTVHPPYWTKLRLVQYIRQPFRLLFNAYDGDVKNLAAMTFQINTLDVNQPSQFVKIGDMIAGTKFKVLGFQPKQVVDPNTQSNTDVSELTVQNTENGDKVVLVLERMANSPDSYALLRYLWNNTDFRVKKGQQFGIPPECTPENKLLYTLDDVTDANATVTLPDGKTTITVPPVSQ